MADENNAQPDQDNQRYRLDAGAPVAAPNPVKVEFFTETERVTAIQKALGIETTGQWDTDTNKAFTEWLRLEQAEHIGPDAKQSDGWWGRNTEAALQGKIDPAMMAAVSELHASGRLNQLHWRNENHSATLVELEQARPEPAPIVNDVAPAMQPMPDPALHVAAAAFNTAVRPVAPSAEPPRASFAPERAPAPVVERPPVVEIPRVADPLPARMPGTGVAAADNVIDDVIVVPRMSAGEVADTIDNAVVANMPEAPRLNIDDVAAVPVRAPSVMTEAPRPVAMADVPSAPAIASMVDDLPPLAVLPPDLPSPAVLDAAPLRAAFDTVRLPPLEPLAIAPDGPRVLSGDILDANVPDPTDMRTVGTAAGPDVRTGAGNASSIIEDAVIVSDDVAHAAQAATATANVADNVAEAVADAGILAKFGRAAGFAGRAAPFVGLAVGGAVAGMAMDEAMAAESAGMLPPDALIAQAGLNATYAGTGAAGILTAGAVEAGGAAAYNAVAEQFGVDPVIAYMTRPGFLTDLGTGGVPALDAQEVTAISARYSEEGMAPTFAAIRERYDLPENVTAANGATISIEQAVRNDESREKLQQDFAGNSQALAGVDAMHFAARAQATGQYWVEETARREQQATFEQQTSGAVMEAIAVQGQTPTVMGMDGAMTVDFMALNVATEQAANLRTAIEFAQDGDQYAREMAQDILHDMDEGIAQQQVNLVAGHPALADVVLAQHPGTPNTVEDITAKLREPGVAEALPPELAAAAAGVTELEAQRASLRGVAAVVDGLGQEPAAPAAPAVPEQSEAERVAENAFWDEHGDQYDEMYEAMPTAAAEGMPPSMRDMAELRGALHQAEIDMMLGKDGAADGLGQATDAFENMFRALVEGGGIAVVAQYMQNQGLIAPPEQAAPDQAPQRQPAPAMGMPGLGG